MKQVKSLILSAAAATVLLLSACQKKIDEAYKNPNADVRVPVEQLLPGIIGNMVISYSAAGTNYGPQNDGQYVGRYVQFWATNTTANQYDQMGGATGASDILGSIWAMHYYGQGQNLNRMVEWAIEENKPEYAGVGYAIRAWSWLMLTDMHGEVILKEAFNTSQLVFKYDTQEEVYEEVKRNYRLAMQYLNQAGSGVNANLATGDAFLNGGNIDKWKKFANAVMAKVFHRTTNKASYQADSVVYYANLAQTTNADNSIITFSNTGGTGTYSYYSPFRGNIGTLRQSRYIADLESGLNTTFPGAADPRAYYIIRENPNGTFKGIRPNKGTDGLAANDQPANFWGGTFASTTAPATDATARYIFKNAPKWPVITASEMAFVKAEALYRKGDKAGALTAYVNGINLNFDQLIADYQVSVPAGKEITPASRATYLAAVTPTAANLTLSHIMQQKYIAMYGWGLVEVWVDLRRYHYTDVEAGQTNQVYAGFTPPTGTDLFVNNNGGWVYRARPRYNSEYLYNVAELQRIGATALDYNTKKMWFTEP